MAKFRLRGEAFRGRGSGNYGRGDAGEPPAGGMLDGDGFSDKY